MNIRPTLILAVVSVSFLFGCTSTPDERHAERLLRDRSWPRIQQIAKAEVEKREKLLGWPADAGYLPMDHRDKVWVVMAMADTKGKSERVISVMIGDDGAVLDYKR